MYIPRFKVSKHTSFANITNGVALTDKLMRFRLRLKGQYRHDQQGMESEC